MAIMRMVLAMIALVWALPAMAQPVRVADLRAQAMAGDMAAVGESLARHQAAFVAGDIDSDQARAPYALFHTTHPQIIAFTDDWLAARPASPYALTARAWVLNRMGWLVRGEKSGRDTHPQAFAEHRAMHA